MNRYTSYCSEEQTNKAFLLGAPIQMKLLKKRLRLTIPKAEEMIGWLEEQGVYFKVGYTQHFHVEGGKNIFDKLTYDYHISIIGKTRLLSKESAFTSRKEATLAAIDAALEYLIYNKNN